MPIFDPSTDLKFLSINFNDPNSAGLFLKSLNIVDLAVINSKKTGVSLALLAMDVLGVSINKLQRMSAWQNRPLTQSQIQYAAIDAYVLLEIYHKVCSKN
ncbi:MAG: hypothetical protein MHPSP_001066 [Paramarteilia canceri]